jgi:predicted SprT family Zn-dependent metalloprotease
MRNLACLIPLTVICLCARYAYGREKLRHTDLHAAYAKINRDSFDGSLPDVEVSWANLGADYGKTFDDGGSFRIEIDRGIKSERELMESMRHESCHVATIEFLSGEDAHGAKFRDCMKRFR